MDLRPEPGKPIELQTGWKMRQHCVDDLQITELDVQSRDNVVDIETLTFQSCDQPPPAQPPYLIRTRSGNLVQAYRIKSADGTEHWMNGDLWMFYARGAEWAEVPTGGGLDMKPTEETEDVLCNWPSKVPVTVATLKRVIEENRRRKIMGQLPYSLTEDEVRMLHFVDS